MTKTQLTGAVGTAALLLAAQGASALSYDQNVTPDVIFGSGNANGGYTVDTQNNVELGLRGKLRHNASGAPENTYNSNGDGTYSFAAGVAPTQSFPTGVWSFEWSINTDQDGTSGQTLGDLTYELGLDSNPTLGTTYTVFDPINDANPGEADGHWDHSMGNNGTGNGAGLEAPDIATYATYLSTYNVAQQSWKAHWYIPGFDPTVDGQYEIYLAAFDGATEVARTSISIIVGAGSSVVPVPAAAWFFGPALGLLGWFRRRVA